MTEQLIKSADRVKDHGEVFTPKWIVEKMLNQPEIDAKVKSLTATFLEPSAGEGAFLTELLDRKLQYAATVSSNGKEFNINALRVLSTLYGIEFMEDNVEVLVMNMILTFSSVYGRLISDEFDAIPEQKVIESAKVIIRANMAQGDTLKYVTATGDPIIFSEWQPVGKTRVKRIEYTFESIVNGEGPTGTVRNINEQLDLFALDDEPEEDTSVSYAECKWTDVYKELVE
ncbi:hypothetical protein [Limosilactobacillus equigenerosi]|uniref:site-specific DNA-methyltransferase (adenine-specific) n=2 Tax=Limosilactobacillus TaxID=2742598 RepID=A0A0R1UXK0_9LACO|nr:hypothetical protein [Limosilactobacillus equigenerosi]KRL96266.1 DNA methyltransferase [Limosilactobacillus equigenerosi DSM 18793 = JCM 14505]